jgi:endo-1,3(4)-beta-glucanase
MLPISPISTYTRSKEFVAEEWQSIFKDGKLAPKSEEWTGILRANQALIDPLASFEFFASDKFNYSRVGMGDSRAYYLFYSSVLARLW